jgi:hypothetical protein
LAPLGKGDLTRYDVEYMRHHMMASLFLTSPNYLHSLTF